MCVRLCVCMCVEGGVVFVAVVVVAAVCGEKGVVLRHDFVLSVMNTS